MDNLLTVNEVADRLRLKVSTIYSWVHKKQIPFVKLGSKVAFQESQINDYIKSNSFFPQ